MDYNSALVKETLKLTLGILESCKAEYRLLGSTVTAAILGKQHRDLHDLDLLAESGKRNFILQKLFELGYHHKTSSMFAFGRKYMALNSLSHDHLLEIGIFWGRFTDEGFLMGTKNYGCLVDAHAVAAQRYSLHGINFYGLPEKTIINGIAQSSSNPKRKNELTLIKHKNLTREENGYIHLFLLGNKVDWLYYSGVSLVNFIGSIRVRLGLPFDPWR